jgi:hypothetical protein
MKRPRQNFHYEIKANENFALVSSIWPKKNKKFPDENTQPQKNATGSNWFLKGDNLITTTPPQKTPLIT